MASTEYTGKYKTGQRVPFRYFTAAMKRVLCYMFGHRWSGYFRERDIDMRFCKRCWKRQTKFMAMREADESQ